MSLCNTQTIYLTLISAVFVVCLHGQLYISNPSVLFTFMAEFRICSHFNADPDP
jgi:hypothetical protein